jgi:hypothetical protein
MSRSSLPPRLDNSNYTWRRVQIMQLFVMQFSLPSRHSIPLWFKYCPQHPASYAPKSNAYIDWATATCRRNSVPTFTDGEVSRGQRGGSFTAVNLSFLDRSRYFLSSSSSFILTRAGWTPFQTHCHSENLAAPEIETGTSGSAARKSDH